MLSDRINIQYSIDVNELPTEIKRLLGKVQEHLTLFAADNDGTLKELEDKDVLSLNTLEEVDMFRRRLAAMDYILNDVTHIITAYLEFKTQGTKGENASAPSPPSPEDDDAEDRAELHANMLFNDLGGLQDKVNELNKQT